MKLPCAGQHLHAVVITGSDLYDTDVQMTPKGVAEHLGTERFTICYRYLGIVPLGVLFGDEPARDDPVTVRCGASSVKGPAVLMGHGRTLRSLTDLEVEEVRGAVEMEKIGGRNVLCIPCLTKEPGAPLLIARTGGGQDQGPE